MTDRCKRCDRPPVPWTGHGPHPRYCEQHNPHPKRTKARRERQADAEAAAARARVLGESPKIEPASEPSELEREQRAAKSHIRREGGRRAIVALRAWRARQLAIALGWESEPRKAAELVGLELDDAELAELVTEAQKHPGLTKRDPAAIGDLINGTIALKAIALAAGADNDANAIRRLAETLELVQGKAQVALTELRDILQLPSGDEWTTEKLLPTELRSIPGGKGRVA